MGEAMSSLELAFMFAALVLSVPVSLIILIVVGETIIDAWGDK